MRATLFKTEEAVAYAHVAVERAVDQYPEGLTYGIPEALADLQPGERVIVPLGRGNTPTAGYIIQITADTDLDPDKLKLIEKRDHSAARLPGQLLQLASWISAYYCTPIGTTLTTMLPAAVKRSIGSVTRVMIDLSSDAEPDAKLPRGQRRVLEALHELRPDQRPIEMRSLAERAGIKTTSPIRRLLDQKLVQQSQRTAVEATWMEHATDSRAPQRLTPSQQQVIDSIAPLLSKGFSAHLLYGVTGSGKTEIYIQLIQKVVDAGLTALLLVPEISLTPQTGGRLIGRFPQHRVAILHSGLTAAQRHQQWRLAAQGAAHVVLGARSAVFAPIPDHKLGLIIVDEEHDDSYKQDQAPRYHGRDVAVRRAQLSPCPIVLGSATPSLESWHNATGKHLYTLHELKERVPGSQLPRVDVVDFRQQQKQHKDRRVHLIGPLLQNAISATLDAGAQVLLLLNRRGYANYIACPDMHCGWTMTCDDCDVTMVYHVNRKLPTGGYVSCHHCLAQQRLSASCPDCGKSIVTFGLGTQRVEEELAGVFPQLVSGETMMRLDSDTMHGARDFHSVLKRFGDGEIKVMLGTQMIAKGLDYPNVRLVGVINADTAINLPDFRATERTFQLVSQVAGRSGRGVEAGRVIVQSFNPSVPAIQLAAKHDYVAFAKLELEERRACGLPPIARMARIIARHEDHVACVELISALANRLREMLPSSVRMRGPAPCPISRIAGKHRQQIELIAPDAQTLQRLLTEARNRGLLQAGSSGGSGSSGGAGPKLAIDVDPTAML